LFLVVPNKIAFVCKHELFLLRDKINMHMLWNTGLEKVVEELHDNIPSITWDFEGIHYFDNGPLTVQYLFVLDSLNFCFWPGEIWLILSFAICFVMIGNEKFMH
jgi:hypothetical protein